MMQKKIGAPRSPLRGRANLSTRKEPRTAVRVLRQFFKALDETGRPLDAIGKQMGVTANNLTRWRNGTCAPNVADFEAALQAMGCQLVIEHAPSQSGND